MNPIVDPVQVAAQQSKKVPVPSAIQITSKALLNSPPLGFRPLWAIEFNSLAQGIVFSQLAFRGGHKVGSKPIRLSYLRMHQRDFPFYTKRYLIDVIAQLEAKGAIEVKRDGGVNRYLLHDWETTATPSKANEALMLIFPELACKLGVLEAIALQQIHLRHSGCDGSMWVIKSLEEWHEHCFMFLGLATVKRLFSRMRQSGLILVRKREGKTGSMNTYRVNYVRVAEGLGIPTPEDTKPGPDQKDWIGPVTLQKFKNPQYVPWYQQAT